ncbi:MAG: pyridoxal phosphate-dependent aminotransferase [Alphaproteobacteria bacterium]
MSNTFKLSKRSDISMFRALDILRQTNERDMQGQNIMRMGAGQPCFGVPESVLNHATDILKSDPTQGYTEAIGMPALRERIAQHYKDDHNLSVNPEHIVITTGSSSGFILNFIAAFDAGDKVAITTPAYPAYRNILKSLDIEVIEIEAHAKDNYQPTLELLQNCGQKFDGLIINSPSNPSGTIIDGGKLQKICQWCDQNGIHIISDEAYQGITYGKKATSALQHSNNAIVLNTFSKYFAMTGWRLGWTVLPNANMAKRVKKLCESLFVSAPTLSQHVACKIFDHMDVLDGYVRHYKENREILFNELPQANIHNFTDATGAFYIYADIHHLSNNSEEFCRNMLDQARVSTTPGTDFDLTRGHGGIRICYADSKENIVEACTRLKNWQS